MSRKKRYIKSLSKDERALLEQGRKSKKGYQFQNRCHAILLSESGKTVSELQDIYGVSPQTIYSWFDRWEQGGIEALENKPGRGRKAVLRTDNKEHVKIVDKAVAKVNKKGGNLLAEIESELDLERGLSKKMLRTFLKKLDTSGNEVDES
jgi:transposase